MRLRGNRVKKGEGCGVDCWLDKIEIFSAFYGSLRYYEKRSFLYPKNQVPVLQIRLKFLVRQQLLKYGAETCLCSLCLPSHKEVLRVLQDLLLLSRPSTKSIPSKTRHDAHIHLGLVDTQGIMQNLSN